MRHSLNFSTLISVLRGYINVFFLMKRNDIFSTSTQILESVYVPGHTIQGTLHAEGKHQGHQIAFSDF